MSRHAIKAVEWVVGPQDDPQNGWNEVRVVSKIQRDGSILYAVQWRGWTANKEGEWEYEPLPSSRDDAYIADCRWEDWEDAARMADRMVDAEHRKHAEHATAKAD